MILEKVNDNRRRIERRSIMVSALQNHSKHSARPIMVEASIEIRILRHQPRLIPRPECIPKRIARQVTRHVRSAQAIPDRPTLRPVRDSRQAGVVPRGAPLVINRRVEEAMELHDGDLRPPWGAGDGDRGRVAGRAREAGDVERAGDGGEGGDLGRQRGVAGQHVAEPAAVGLAGGPDAGGVEGVQGRELADHVADELQVVGVADRVLGFWVRDE